MKILITGSEGFLGRNLTKILENSGHAIIDFDFKKNKSHDIRNTQIFEDIVKTTNPDICVHLAAVANLNLFDENIKESEEINVVGTLGIVDVCKKYGVRLLFASTCCCYGNNKLASSSEESVVWPTDPYAHSKRTIEKMILEENKTRNPNEKIIICRLATFYGSKFCRRALATSLFIEKIHNGEPIKIHGSGESHRTYTHVYDMCTGFEKLIKGIQDEKIKYEIYNISRSIPISVMDIVRNASKLLNKPAIIEFVEDRPSGFDQLIIENARLRELGWIPKYDFENGMKEMVSSFLTQEPREKWIL